MDLFTRRLSAPVYLPFWKGGQKTMGARLSINNLLLFSMGEKKGGSEMTGENWLEYIALHNTSV